MSFDLNQPTTSLQYINIETRGDINDSKKSHSFVETFNFDLTNDGARNYMLGVSRFKVNVSTIPFVPAIPGPQDLLSIDNSQNPPLVAFNACWKFLNPANGNNLNTNPATLQPSFNVPDFFRNLNRNLKASSKDLAFYDNNNSSTGKQLLFLLRDDGRVEITYTGTADIEFAPRIFNILGLTSTETTKPYLIKNNLFPLITTNSCISRIDQLRNLHLIVKAGLPVDSEMFNLSRFKILTDFQIDFTGDTNFSCQQDDTNGLNSATKFSCGFVPRTSLEYIAEGDNIRWITLSGDDKINTIQVEMLAVLNNQGFPLKSITNPTTELSSQEIEIPLLPGEEFRCKVALVHRKTF